MIQAIATIVAISMLGCIPVFVAFGFATLVRRWA